MSRRPIPIHIDDLSDFARRLGRELPEQGHQSLLNMLARASGFRNWQHLRASHGDRDPEPAPDMEQLRRALRHFDAEGRYTHVPGKQSLQLLCLWAIWGRLPAGEGLSEREISARIDALTVFRDAARLRRMLVDTGLARRTRDGARYERIEQRPGPEARALLRALPDPRG